ncbi:MAG TPA: zinc-dependent alcohol dehydrogenase family protein [Nitrosopumilaceae archaeon]|nr:zinc-dependent alcohol dehydrogenase family protein [Nitrosopumilaceae archaeon]
MDEKMRAMVLTKLAPIETKPLKLQMINRHKITDQNEILVKIEACGVCHSQLHGIEGDWQKYGFPPALPTVPGHEIVGKVVEIGSKVTKFKIGDRAGVSPLLGSCMKCDYCMAGKENLCDSMDVLGESLRGGYAEYVNVHEDFATKIPDSMRPEYAAPLFCAGITAYKAVAASEPKEGKKIAIFGIGGVGHMAIQFAKINGCNVIAVSRNKKHLDVAKRLGADQVVTYKENQKEFLKELSEKVGPIDAAIVFAPVESVADSAIKSVKKGGLVVIATLYQDIRSFDVTQEKTIRGTIIGSRKDMEEVVRLAAKHKLEVVYQAFPLEQANEVLAKLKKSEIEARAVLIP